MSPPFISDYKKAFTLKRLVETLLGPKLFAPPVLILIQVLIFSQPIILFLALSLSLTNPSANVFWTSLLIGLSICFADTLLSFTIYALKRGGQERDVGPSPILRRTSSFLAQEDQVSSHSHHLTFR
jgi:hypothetical protein